MTANSAPVNSDSTLNPGRRSAWLSWFKKAHSIWLPTLIGLVTGIAGAFFLIQQDWAGLIVLLLIPAVALLVAYPFFSVLIWLVALPFFLQGFIPSSRYLFWTLHRAIIPLALIVALFHLLSRRNTRTVRMVWIDLALLTFIVLSLLNILLMTEQPMAELVRYYDRFLIPLMMFWLVRLLVPTERDLRWLIWAAAFLILSQGAIGLMSWFAPGLLPVDWLSRVGERTVGTFGNPAVYTSTLVFCILLLFESADRSRSVVGRVAALLLTAAGFFLVFFSFSRGSWFGALVVCFGLLFLYPKVLIKMVIAGSLLSIAILSLPAFSGYLDFAQQRLLDENTAEARVVSNAATLQMIEAKPLQGWGFGNHEKYDENFKSIVFGLTAPGSLSSHNTYLLMAAEMGMPGLLLYFIPAIYLLILSIRRHRQLPAGGVMGRSMLIMLWLLLLDHFILANFTDLVQSNFYSTTIWWLALGWIANIVNAARFERLVVPQWMRRVYEK